MRLARLLLSAAVLSGLAFAAPARPAVGVAAPLQTNLTATALDLGDLGGSRSEAMAVDGTIVVGWAQTEVVGERHAFAYDLAAAEPAMIDLGSLAGRSVATDVDGTVVVGTYDQASELNFRAFAYDLAAQEPEMIDLGTLGGLYATARDVEGTIVTGMSETASGETHAFAYDLAAAEPKMIDLGSLGGGYSYGVAVDGTTVVGESTTAAPREYHAFAYDLAAAEPVMRDLGTLGGGWSGVTAAAGTTVTGVADTASGESHAFAYDLAAAEPAMRDLGTLGGPDSRGVDVDGPTVVGSSDTAAGESRAFAYDLAAAEPSMQDLGTVPGGERTRVGATAIDGDIVIGTWQDRRVGSYPSSFAYDLAADESRMLDLGSWRGSSYARDVDGDVVVGYAAKGYAERATAWVLRETTRPMISFQRFEGGVKEGDGRTTIRVTRYGRTDRAVTVRYRVRSFTTRAATHAPSSTAKAGQDFVATSGKLRFAAGSTSRSFKVKILDDRRREGKEFLLLTLSRPSSPALLGTPSWSQLRIKANDR